MYVLWPAGNGSVSKVSFHWSPLWGVQRAVCLLPESLEVFVCAERQHWPVSRQCSSDVLFCIGKRVGEPRNIFKLALPVYHGLDGSLGVFGLPEWVPAPPVPIICHLVIPTIPFQSWWPLLLWLVGFGLQCILESSVSSGSSTKTSALIGASLVTPKSSAACLAVLSASLFPEPGGYLFLMSSAVNDCNPFWFPGSIYQGLNFFLIFNIFFTSCQRPLSLYRALSCGKSIHTWSLCKCLSSYLLTAGGPGLEHIVQPVGRTSVMAES